MVDSNIVYQTVLTILNKEQRGYLDAEEFNNIARIVQREIFESYFTKFSGAPSLGPTIADPKMFIAEKISYFESVAELTDTDSPSFFSWPSNFYRLGVVTDDNIVVDMVDHKQIAYINQSPLTAPSAKQPVYVIHDGGIQVWPKEEQAGGHTITMVYMREPDDPSVTYGFNSDMEVVLQSQNNFDLHQSEMQEIVARICAYAGVIVRAPEVTQFAQQTEQKLTAAEQ